MSVATSFKPTSQMLEVHCWGSLCTAKKFFVPSEVVQNALQDAMVEAAPDRVAYCPNREHSSTLVARPSTESAYKAASAIKRKHMGLQKHRKST